MKKRNCFFRNEIALGDSLAIRSSSVSACCLFLSRLMEENPSQVLYVVPDRGGVEERAREFEFMSSLPSVVIPAYEHFGFLPFVPDPANAARRIWALNLLQEGRSGIYVCPASLLAERLIPGREIARYSEIVMEGEETDREWLLRWLLDTGYERTVRVLRHGQFSVRGEILDVFPPGFSGPLRILFFDDLVEQIRLFDPDTQRTLKRTKEAVLLPAAESIFSDTLIENARKHIVEKASENGWSGSQVAEVMHTIENRRQSEGSLSLLPFLYGRPWSLFDFLSEDAVVVLESPMGIVGSLLDTRKRMEDAYEGQIGKGRLLPPLEGFCLDPRAISEQVGRFKRVFINPSELLNSASETYSSLTDVPSEEVELPVRSIGSEILSSVSRHGSELFGRLFDRLGNYMEQGERIVIVAESKPGLDRASALLEHYGQRFRMARSIRDACSEDIDAAGHEGGFLLVEGFVGEPFHLTSSGWIFLDERSIFGSSASGTGSERGKRARRLKPVALSEMSEGDLVVHRDKGIGRYLGLVRMNIHGVDGEFVHLEYHGGDKLYVPVDRLGLLQKYTGLDGREPRLDRLGGRSWQLRKQKVKKAIKEVAHELVELYALRKVKKGVSFSEPDEMYRQFEAAFPYEETPDQREAVRDIIEDLVADYPMDRLLCGDVGFGKTEVAMRAAFLAVENGYQVALLVPTTLLAEQHERTFRERFSNFPVTIAGMSRMKSRSEQRQILSRLRQHEVDILIGTHRILQNDVVFKRLGLVIIDEEHRFGVKHKEKLKLLSRDINCLSLTATPIPRTLQLSLLGIRDLSTLEVPPRGRVAIKTFVAEYDDSIVKEAIERELGRCGQVFFVHNRIKGIHSVADRIKRLVPDAKVDVAHGQMEPAELEEKMIGFVRGEIDCLVCTTIIESGLDIPSANTLIINRADMLGMADLYQLRGRVGRSSRQAYAYLLVPDLEAMSRDASMRLKAIMETSGLGAGMNLAMHDLKIRGAGNLLGVAQAGQIAEVGYDLYLDLLKEAIDDIKGETGAERYEPEVNLSVSAYVPEEYVPDISERLSLYRWFSQVENEEDKTEVMRELEDRFGKVPEEVANLLDVMIVKALLRMLGSVRMDGIVDGGPRLTLTFGPNGPTGASRLIELIQKDGRLKLLPGDRVMARLSEKRVASDGFMEEIKRLLKELVKLTN